MSDIKEAFGELQEALRAPASPTCGAEMIPVIVRFMDALIEPGAILPEDIFDGLSEQRRREILISYGTKLFEGAQSNFQHHCR